MPGLYVHIPFCLQKCKYCDFVSFAGQTHRIPAYLDALQREIENRAPQFAVPFHTVFIGGGTPSLLSGPQIERLLFLLNRHFQINSDAEVTIEMNPGTLTRDMLASCRRAGINRLSIGVQSLQDPLLERIGRIHNAKTARQAILDAQEAGFLNINVDIMYGLPGQTLEDVLSTMHDLICLSPTHISAYSLIVEETTPLFDAISKKEVCLPEEDIVFCMQDMLNAILPQHGYARYEISNYAKEGFCCKHNLQYWQNESYLGLGAGAHSAFVMPRGQSSGWARFENPQDINAYIAHTEPLQLQFIEKAEEAFECVMLGLRQTAGLSLAAFQKRFSLPLQQVYPKSILQLMEQGFLELSPTHARLTPQGLDLQNRALQAFMLEMEEDGFPL